MQEGRQTDRQAIDIVFLTLSNKKKKNNNNNNNHNHNDTKLKGRVCRWIVETSAADNEVKAEFVVGSLRRALQITKLFRSC